jgi:hypothetical protein
MNLKKFRSVLLASVAAAFMVASVTGSAYATSSSKRVLTDENISTNLRDSHYAYATPGNFTMRAKSVANSSWTLADTSLLIAGDGKKKATVKFKTIKFNTSTEKDDIEAGIEATIKPYIQYIISLQSTAFDGITGSLGAWATSKTGFTYDDKAYNPFSLLSVTIGDDEYAVFKNPMTGMKDVDPSVAFFHSFAKQAHGKTLAAYVLKMIQDEVKAANLRTAPALSSPKATPKKTSKSTATPSKGTPSLHKQLMQKAVQSKHLDPLVEIEKDPTSQPPLPQIQVTDSTQVVTTPVQQPLTIPTGGAQNLIDDFDDLLGDLPETPPVVTTLPQSQIATTPTKQQVTPQPKAKSTKSTKPTTPVVVAPTEEDIEKAITTLISTHYIGLDTFLNKDEDLLVLAKDILSEYENDTYTKLTQVKKSLKELTAERDLVDAGDLSAYTELFTPSEFDDNAQEAFEAFSEAAEAGKKLTRYTSRGGIIFVNKNDGQLLVSDNGKLFDVETMSKALEGQREQILDETLESIYDRSMNLKSDKDNAEILKADEILDDLYRFNKVTFKFVEATMREAEKKSSTLSIRKIFEEKLRAEVLSK